MFQFISQLFQHSHEEDKSVDTLLDNFSKSVEDIAGDEKVLIPVNRCFLKDKYIDKIVISREYKYTIKADVMYTIQSNEVPITLITQDHDPQFAISNLLDQYRHLHQCPKCNQTTIVKTNLCVSCICMDLFTETFSEPKQSKESKEETEKNIDVV